MAIACNLVYLRWQGQTTRPIESGKSMALLAELSPPVVRITTGREMERMFTDTHRKKHWKQTMAYSLSLSLSAWVGQIDYCLCSTSRGKPAILRMLRIKKVRSLYMLVWKGKVKIRRKAGRASRYILFLNPFNIFFIIIIVKLLPTIHLSWQTKDGIQVQEAFSHETKTKQKQKCEEDKLGRQRPNFSILKNTETKNNVMPCPRRQHQTGPIIDWAAQFFFICSPSQP